jgi:hypothetical protein
VRICEWSSEVVPFDLKIFQTKGIFLMQNLQVRVLPAQVLDLVSPVPHSA